MAASEKDIQRHIYGNLYGSHPIVSISKQTKTNKNLCKIFVSLRMAQVQTETCSTHLKATI